MRACVWELGGCGCDIFRVFVGVRACVRACVRARGRGVGVGVGVRAVHVFISRGVCVRGWVGACGRACMRACVRACGRACLHVQFALGHSNLCLSLPQE